MANVTSYRRATILFAAVSLLWLSPLLLAPLGLPHWVGGEFSDLRIAHLPNALYIRRSLIEFGQLPLWNNQILAGIPFLADPLAGVWYPPLWLLVLQPSSLMVNLLLLAHIVWAGVGTWGFARANGLSPTAATVAGLAFSGTPKLIGHIGLGHLTLVCAVAWTPWLLLSAELAGLALLRRDRRLLARGALTGGLLGFTFLIDPRWVLPALLLTLAFTIRLVLRNRRGLGNQARSLLRAGMAAGLASAGLAAALAVPLLEYIPLTTRASMTAGESLAFSLPPERLLGVLVADPAGWPEWTTYVGASTVLLISLALAARLQSAGFWIAVLAAGWLLALGDSLPLAKEALAAFPGISWLRVPPRMLFLSAFAASILAGWGVEALDSGPTAGARRLARLVTVAASSGYLFVGLGVWLVTGGDSSLVPALIAFASAALILLCLRSERQRGALSLLALLLIVDLAWFASKAIESRPWPDSGVKSDLVTVIHGSASGSGFDPVANPYRVYSPSYAIPQDIAARSGLGLVDGVNPLQLASTWRFMSTAAGFESAGYSVTLPPFPAGDPQIPRDAVLDGERLGLLNVVYVASSYPLEISGAHQAIPAEAGHIYSLTATRPRAWVEEPRRGDPSAWRPVQALDWTPNRIRLQASGPGRLVLSEVHYPGWQAEVDGTSLPVETAYDLLRAVELSPGEHEVTFAFKPRSVLIGAVLSVVTLAGLALVWWKGQP